MVIMATGVTEGAKSGDFDLFRTIARDETAEVFLKVLYLVMWDESDELEQYADEEYFEFASDVHEAMIFLGGFMRKVHSKVFNHYFRRNKICKRTVFKLLKNYSRNMMIKCENVFFVWLHSLTLIDTLLFYLEEKNLQEESEHFRTFASKWWEYIFNKIIKTKFYAEGGWDSFIDYILEEFYPHDLPENCEQIWEIPLDNLNFNYFELEVSDEENYPISDEENRRERTGCKENQMKNIHSQSEGNVLNLECMANRATRTQQNVRNITQPNSSKLIPVSNIRSAANLSESYEVSGSKVSEFINTGSNPWEEQDGAGRQQPSRERASCIVPKKRRTLNDQSLSYFLGSTKSPVVKKQILHNDSKPDFMHTNSEVNVNSGKVETEKNPFKNLFPNNVSVPTQQFGHLSKKPRLENEENEQQMGKPVSETELSSVSNTVGGAACEDQSRFATANPRTNIFDLSSDSESSDSGTDLARFVTLTFQDLQSDSD